MPALLPQEEYNKSLPKKRLGASVLFFDDEGRLLIVKPTYKDGWVIPGGTVEENESPAAGAQREAREEVGIMASNLRLVAVRYSSAKETRTESLQCIFDGGVLDAAQRDSIALAENEIASYKFVTEQEAETLLVAGLKKQLPYLFRVLEDKTVTYSES